MTPTQNLCQILLPASLVLTVVSDPLATTGSPDQLISDANRTHSTSVVPVIVVPNTTAFTTIFLLNYTQSSTTADVFSPNSTQDGTAIFESTTLPLTTDRPGTSQMTTEIQSSTKVKTASTVTFTGSTQGIWTTVNITKTSNHTPFPLQTTESHMNISMTASTSAPGYSNTKGLPSGMSFSEKSMTIFFSVVTGLVALVIFIYAIYRCKRKTQYSHRPLYNNSEETVDRFVAAEDTLVISGGLYDGPCNYNPTMNTLHEEEFNGNHLFPSQPTQFRLEFMKEDQENKSPDYGPCNFETFQPVGNDS